MIVRAPNHLGDGVMAQPAIAALAAREPCWVVAPAWGPDVYGHLPGVQFSKGVDEQRAVLFKPSFSAVWALRRCPERIGLVGDLGRWLLTNPVHPGEGHRMDDYARVAAAAGARPQGLPALPEVQERELDPAVVLILAGTRSGATVRPAKTLHALIAGLGSRALLAAGPGDRPTLAGLGGTIIDVDIPQLCALAVAAQHIVALDSGPAHVAAAARRGAGLDPAVIQVLYGATDPARTGPPGTTAQVGPTPKCWPCYRKYCKIGTPCLDHDLTGLIS